MKDDKYTFTVVGDDGREIECEVILTFESEMTNKEYVVYTDNSVDEDGLTRVFASVLCDETKSLQPVETDEEWEMIDDLLKSLADEMPIEYEI